MKASSSIKASILVVEDESIVALDIKQRLEAMGYQVVGILDSGEKAIHRTAELNPDLVLMDIKLKGKMDGIEAAEILRASLHLPIIFLTAFADEPTLQRARVTESFGYILKPFEERELSINIEMALYKHRMEDALRESEGRLRTIYESVLDGLFLVDPEGVILDVNPAGCTMFGYTRDEIIQSHIWMLIFPEDRDKQAPPTLEALRFRSGVEETRMRHKDGSEVWVEMTLAPSFMDGKPQAVGVLRDITSRKRAVEALRESEERYSLAARGVNDGLWDWNLKTGAIYLSSRWKEMFGFKEGEIGSNFEDWLGLISPEDQERFNLDLSNHLAGLTPFFQNESRVRTAKSGLLWMLTRGVAVCDSDGVAYRIAGSQSDVTERKLAEQQLLHDAFHDALTGLPNRSLFLDRLERTMERSRRNEHIAYSVLFLDLDRFKVINDSLGHQQGDHLLVEFAERLDRSLRSTDTLARLGGDEFVILLEEMGNPNDTGLVADRILEELKQPFDLDGQTVYVTCSIGIVTGSIEYMRPEEILRDADIAMYRAKADGKARHAHFDLAMRAGAVTRLEIEGDLRLALNRQEFCVYYQPILSLESGMVLGFEALLRWFHPVRGAISPVEFIPVAEETGLILPIGRWVLSQACNQLREWQRQFPQEPPLTMSVNISGRQITHPAFLEQVKQILQDTNIDPKTLKLEITESLLMVDAEETVSVLNRLREMGIQLLIDDFGTGFSNLGYVPQFPINCIKIDKLFVNQMGESGKNSEIASTIVKLANGWGLGTIAEGIETSEQLDQLKVMACESGQGWLFSKALSSEQIAEYLTEIRKRTTPEA
jgi:diguanylate cyclase (GGDEF)-like protein/PAS domain S-box-containing protein